MKKLTLHLKKLEKEEEEQHNKKLNRGKEIIEIRVEVNEKEIKNTLNDK